MSRNWFVFLLLSLATLLTGCGGEAWERDPDVQAAKVACTRQDYACIERHAVETLNPDVCRLAGIAIDDMCLQAVYEAANDPAICERIYLRSVQPNCQAYYAARAAPSPSPQVRDTASSTPAPPTPAPAPLTSTPAPTHTPTPAVELELSVATYPLARLPAPEADVLDFADSVEDDPLARHAAERAQHFPDPTCSVAGDLGYCATLGDDRFAAWMDESDPEAGYVVVARNEEQIARIPVGDTGGAIPSLWGLWAYDGHWAVETALVSTIQSGNVFTSTATGQVVADGVSLNDELGYDETFGFQTLGGRPFYFFEHQGTVDASYDGVDVPLGFDEVLHLLCCSAAAFNPECHPNLVTFYGRKGDTWYYGEIALSPAEAVPASRGSGSDDGAARTQGQIEWTENVTVAASLNAASAGAPAWSPNGSTLAFHAGEGLALAQAPDFIPHTVYTGSVLGAMWDWPGMLWQPDGTEIVFRTSTERAIDGQTLSVGTLGAITIDGVEAQRGRDPRDLLPGWKAAFNGPSYAVGLVGWLDRETLVFHAHCGTECESLYALDLPSGDLLDLHTFGPRFYVQPGNPWIVAQHGPSGRLDFTLVHRDSATVVHPGMTNADPPASAAITRTLPLPGRAGSAFVDWAPTSLDAGGGQRLLAVAWERGWIPLEESTSNLYLWDVQADTVSLFAPDVLDAAWSPCGRYVALLVPGEPVVQDGRYAGTRPVTEDTRVYSVVVLDVEVGQVQFSAQGPDVALDVWEFFHGRLQPRWSPSGSDRGGGSLLLFFDAGGDLAYYQPATERSGTLTKGAGSTLLGADTVHVSFSPDGQYLALMYDGRDEPARIDVVDLGR